MASNIDYKRQTSLGSTCLESIIEYESGYNEMVAVVEAVWDVVLVTLVLFVFNESLVYRVVLVYFNVVGKLTDKLRKIVIIEIILKSIIFLIIKIMLTVIKYSIDRSKSSQEEY